MNDYRNPISKTSENDSPRLARRLELTPDFVRHLVLNHALAAVGLCLASLTITIADSGGRMAMVASAVMFSFAAAEVCLLAAWLAWGKISWRRAFIAVLAYTALFPLTLFGTYAMLLAPLTPHDAVAHLVFYYLWGLAFLACVAASLGVCVWAGGAWAADDDCTLENARRGKRQFRVVDLFLMTAIVAALVALAIRIPWPLGVDLVQLTAIFFAFYWAGGMASVLAAACCRDDLNAAMFPVANVMWVYFIALLQLTALEIPIAKTVSFGGYILAIFATATPITLTFFALRRRGYRIRRLKRKQA